MKPSMAGPRVLTVPAPRIAAATSAPTAPTALSWVELLALAPAHQIERLDVFGDFADDAEL